VRTNPSIGRKSVITQAEATLRSYLEHSLRTRFNANPCKPHCWFYYGFYDFVLREGRFFSPLPRPGDTQREAAGESFVNAIMNTAAKGVAYVEGYAVRESFFSPVLHAWNSDDDGFVVDTAWQPLGIAYFGVVIPRALVLAARDERASIASSIDNWRQHWPLLRRPWSETLAESAL
jgi:hypothetical protein